MLLGGIGMYLLLTLVTRYVQTPASAGYGFGVDVFVAGLVLVPFSVLGFVGGKLVPPLRERLAPATVLAAGGTAVLVALVLFALTRSQLWLAFAVMGMLGLGVGVFSAAMPAAILAVTPAEETSSAMSFNQVVRSVGLLDRQRAGRPDPGRPHPGRLDLPHRHRICDSVLARRRGDGRYRRRRARASASARLDHDGNAERERERERERFAEGMSQEG